MPRFAIPRITKYYMAVMILNMLSLVLACLTMNLNKRRVRVPKWVVFIVIKCLGQLFLCNVPVRFRKQRKQNDIQRQLVVSGRKATAFALADAAEELLVQQNSYHDDWIYINSILNRVFFAMFLFAVITAMSLVIQQ